jgi:hypothetical protein
MQKIMRIVLALTLATATVGFADFTISTFGESYCCKIR